MFNRIIATSEKILADVTRIARISDLIYQVLCIAFCSYNIYQHAVNNSASLIPYIIILVLSLFYFSYSLYILINGEKRRNKIIKKIIVYSKLGCRVAILVFSIYDIVTKEVSPLSIILAAGMIFLLLIQIIIEIYAFFFGKYIKMIKYAITKDVEEIKVKVDDFQESLPGKTISKFASKMMNRPKKEEKGIIEGEVLPSDKDLQEVESLAHERELKQAQIRAEKEALKQAQREEEKKNKRRLRKEKFLSFFHRNKKKETSQEEDVVLLEDSDEENGF